MANDSTNPGHTSSEPDAASNGDGYFTHAHGDEDAFFGPEQLAQADTGAPVVVPVPQDQNVIRVQVNPGEILELSPPFDAGAPLLGREADGNLAIRVGDVTVILVGFVEANDAAPVVVETSDGQPIDVATLLASTDPNIDIQTAAGPGEGGQGQGADNTGAILALLQGGTGLGGLNAVGAQDGTSLTYGTIDNTILQEFLDTAAAPTSTGTPGGGFQGVSELFLRDPFSNASFSDFNAFLVGYETYVGTTNPGGGWADFQGTAAAGTDFESYLEQTSFTSLVPHSSASPEPLSIDLGALQTLVSTLSSNGRPLYVDGNSTGDTAFVRREGDDALILVIHAHAPGDVDDTTAANGTGGYQIDTFLINRLDHPDSGQDILDLNVPYRIDHPVDGSEEQEVPPTLGTVGVPIQDDIPIASDTVYANFLHAADFKDATGLLYDYVHGQVTDYTTTTGAGHVDEDYIFGGNRDTDNAAGPSEDPARGDDIGSKFLVGALVIDWGADGPAGKTPQGGTPTIADLLVTTPPLQISLAADPFPGLTSGGHALKVLQHGAILGVETLVVGYSEDGQNIAVFTLVLQGNPNAPLFGAFAFELSGPLDHTPGSTPESNLSLIVPIIATDDDGDHPVDDVNITILVNDDAPVLKDVDYVSYVGGEATPAFTSVEGGGNNDTIESKDHGQVDEDWLNGGSGIDHIAGGAGNKDLDGAGDSNAGQFGDETGATSVTGKINVDFGGDGPAEQPFAFTKTFDTSGVPPLFVDAAGNSFKSGGHDLVVLNTSDSGYLDVGYFVEGDPKPFVIFTVQVEDSGEFEFELKGPIDHTGQNEQTLDIKIEVTAIDADGDPIPVPATLDFKVNDDQPDAVVHYTSHMDTSEDGDFDSTADGFGYIDEDFLGDPPANTDNDNVPYGHENGARGDTYGTNWVTGAIGNFGGDGPASTGPAAVLALLSGTFKDADGKPVTQDGQNLVVLSSTASHLAVGLADGPPIFELNLNSDGTFNFNLYGPLDQAPGGTPIENNLLLAFNADVTDGDGDSGVAVIKIQVNDDAPMTVDDDPGPGVYAGNVTANDHTGADGGFVSFVSGFVSGEEPDENGAMTAEGHFGTLTMYKDGTWVYVPSSTTDCAEDFTYTLTDKDGDSVQGTLTVTIPGSSVPSSSDEPLARTELVSHREPDHHDLTLSLVKDTDAGHTLKGGDGSDLIEGSAGNDHLHGRGGNDMLFGGNNDDALYGDAGHDAMSGGDGDDTFHRVDADDLDGTNTLDGIHTIDGGNGYDTVDISGLSTFDSSQALRLENVEHLALEGNAEGGGGTAVTLNYASAYGITQVGGLHALSITGDSADSVHLEASNGNAWHEIGDTHVYEAGIGAARITVTVDHDVAVQLS